MLAVIGLVAFRGLAVEHGMSRGAANLLTLCLASSPLFFKLSLTFLSDVPFVAVTLVATLFYTRALRDERWSSWLAASLAASAAIFIRQFGIALVGGIAPIWLVDALPLATSPGVFARRLAARGSRAVAAQPGLEPLDLGPGAAFEPAASLFLGERISEERAVAAVRSE